MTKQEALKLLVLIESVYCYCSIRDETVVNWFLHCPELNYENVMNRLKEHIRKSPYPPCIGELLNCNDKNCNPKLQESWLTEYIPRKRFFN